MQKSQPKVYKSPRPIFLSQLSRFGFWNWVGSTSSRGLQNSCVNPFAPGLVDIPRHPVHQAHLVRQSSVLLCLLHTSSTPQAKSVTPNPCLRQIGRLATLIWQCSPEGEAPCASCIQELSTSFSMLMFTPCFTCVGMWHALPSAGEGPEVCEVLQSGSDCNLGSGASNRALKVGLGSPE